MIDEGYADFAARVTPILDKFHELGILFALEVHPTEIAFDIASARRTLKALNNHPNFGFNFDPSHLGYQGVDYVKFILEFGAKDFPCSHEGCWLVKSTVEAGVFGGHTEFGTLGQILGFQEPWTWRH